MMKSFSQYLQERLEMKIQELHEDKNTHMEHIEELVLNQGVKGTRTAIDFLRDLRDMLNGHTDRKVNTSLKWDGCVHEDTLVVTNRGSIPIRDIVENRNDILLDLKVYGKNFESELPFSQPTEILETNSQNGSKPWVEVLMENGSTIKLTTDHEVHTSNRGWVKAGELTDGDDVTEM